MFRTTAAAAVSILDHLADAPPCPPSALPALAARLKQECAD
jgi:hypothetical protein